jgi:Ribosomal protein L21e
MVLQSRIEVLSLRSMIFTKWKASLGAKLLCALLPSIQKSQVRSTIEETHPSHHSFYERLFNHTVAMGASRGLRSGTRYAFSRDHKKKGMINLSTFLRPYKFVTLLSPSLACRLTPPPESETSSISKPMAPYKKECPTKCTTAKPA